MMADCESFQGGLSRTMTHTFDASYMPKVRLTTRSWFVVAYHYKCCTGKWNRGGMLTMNILEVRFTASKTHSSCLFSQQLLTSSRAIQFSPSLLLQSTTLLLQPLLLVEASIVLAWLLGFLDEGTFERQDLCKALLIFFDFVSV